MARSSRNQENDTLKAQGTPTADVEPCRFPRLDSEGDDPNQLLSLPLELKHIHDFQKLYGTEPELLRSTLRTAWALVLGCYTGLEDISFGYHDSRDRKELGDSSSSRRNGLSISRSHLLGTMSLGELIKSERADMEFLAWHAGPPNLSQQAERPVFNTIMYIEDSWGMGTRLKANTEAHSLDTDIFAEDTRYSIRLHIGISSSGPTVLFQWWSSDMSKEHAMNVESTFDQILREIILRPDIKVADLNCFSERNKQQVWAWNSSPLSNVKKCTHDVIQEQVVLRPNAEAVCAWDGSLTYAELSELASRLAYRLIDLGVGPEMFVPLCFDKSKWTIVAILGVLKAGGAFVPLDPSHPVPRLQALARKVEAKVILCSPQHAAMLAAVADTILPMDGATIDELPRRTSHPISRVSPKNKCYMIFTSGTTGEPKGALIEHGAFLSSAAAHGPGLLMNSGTRALQFAASTFDISITEILTTLTLGGCVCVPSEEARLNDITEAMEAMRVNWALLTPTFVKFIDPADVPSLKTLATGGEAMTQTIIKTWSHINLVNCYGPAEIAVVSHVNPHVAKGKTPLNIGHQVGVHCWIVDRYNHDRLMPIGAVGELLIEGHTPAREYYKERKKTAEVFISNPLWARSDSIGIQRQRMYKTGDLVRYNSDGTFHIAGRKDTQIKFHGQRIELGEIEHHLNRDSNIKHGMVVLPKAGYCNDRLVTVLQLSNSQGQDLVSKGRPFHMIDGSLKETADSQVVDVKKFLSGRLPTVMIPTMWLVVEFIPRLQSGKLDRKTVAKWVEDMSDDLYRQLNPAAESSPEALSTATDTEKELRSIWSHVLNLHLDQVNLQQSFLSLGGDSISAMQVMGRCRKKGIGLTVQDVLRCKSISHLALLAKEIKSLSHHKEVIEQPFDLSPIQCLYFSRLNHDKGHYNQSFLLRTSQKVQVDDLRFAIETVIKRHSMLRARFSQSGVNGTWQQRVTNEVSSSYRLRAYSVESHDEVDARLADTQTCLDEVNGPMFGADLIDVNGETQLLFMVGHHLVIDLVSWRVILQDVEELLLDPKISSTSEKPLPYQAWCQLQEDHCKDLLPEEVLPIEKVPTGDAEYWGMTERQNVYGEMGGEGFELDSAVTSMLLTKCHEALRTDVPDVLIATLIHSFGQIFTDRAVPPVFAEGHGREVWDSNIDLSRTVGWFTTMYPVYVGASPSDDLINTIRLVKDLRRKVPAKGRPYWASRWLTPKGQEEFGRHWPLELTFNYLGQYQQLEREGALLTPAKEIAGETRGAGDAADVGPNTPCISFFEISAVILKGALRFSFTFNQNMKRQDLIHQWISSSKSTLIMAVDSLTRMNPEPTLSDFPLLSLTYDRLEMMRTQRLPQAGVPSIDLVEDAYPCSPMQQGLLVSTVKDSAFYAAYTLHEVKSKGKILVDAQRLAEAWGKVVQRHAMLRTIFVESVSQEDALYDQIVLKRVEPNLLREHRNSNSDAISSLSAQEPPEHDDITKLLHRFTICTTSTGKVFCRLEISHVIMDGTSMSLIFRDLALAYEGNLNEGPGPLYSDYIAYLQTQPVQSGIDYWKSYLANVEPCHFPLLNDGDSTKKLLKYVRVNFEELYDLQRFCETEGLTFTNAIHTAWALTLRYFTDSEEVCFGYIASARDSNVIEGSEDAIGPFINMIACRINMTESIRLKEIMSKVQQDWVESSDYRHTPLAEVQHALHLSTIALFNTALSYRKLPPTAEADKAQISFAECAPTYDPDEYNVSINIEAGEKEMAIDLAYWTDCLSDKQAENAASTFIQSLYNILHHSNQPIGELDSLSQRNRQQIWEWNHQIPQPVNECVQDVIKRQIRIRPDAPAICSWDANFTYAELDRASTNLAHHLVKLGVQPEVLVLICFDKSAFTVVAMLAVLKAGGACVPLDPTHPRSALELRANDTKSPIVLAAPQFVSVFRDIVSQVLAIDSKLLAQIPNVDAECRSSVEPSNACFIIYTSGSTGKPKGVVLEHRGITTSAKAHGPLLGYTPESRTLQFASYTFDNSLAEIFTTLMHGGVVCVPSDHERLNSLVEVVNKLKVNFMDITPTVATFIQPSEVPTLKRLALGGEAVTKRVVDIWGESVSMHCCYGPSECSINSTYSGEIAKPGKATNIGRAIGSVSWVVDRSNHNRLVPVGCIGELLVEGPIVSRGYLHDPEKTAESFIENPAWTLAASNTDGATRRMYKTGDLVRYDSDGTLMYLGRKDTQVKLNGQRIELGEIEHHLEKNLPADTQSAVELVIVGTNSKKALAAFVSLQSDSSVPDANEDGTTMAMSEQFKAIAKDLEIALTGVMPAYMVPTVWLPIVRMPLTSSGKLNRRRLRAIAQSIPDDQAATYRLASKSGRAPSSEMEKTLARIWESLLGLEANAIGAEDSFFKLGGDSVGAMRLVTTARSMGILLTVAIIFQKSKLVEMASAATGVSNVVQADAEPFSLLKHVSSVSSLTREIASQCRLDLQSVEDIYPCTSIQEGLMALSIKERGAYVAQMVYRLPSDISITNFRDAWESVVAAEKALRTRIVYTRDWGFLQVVVEDPITWYKIPDILGLLENERQLPAYDGGALSRFTIVGESTSSPHFVWTIHHALYDGWCLPLILDKVKACYYSQNPRSIICGPSYPNFIKHLTEIDSSESDSFWRSKLSNVASPQFPRLPHPAYQARASGLMAHTARISRQIGSEITVASTIRAAWALVVAIYSGSDDVVFNETVTGRDAPVPGIADMIGPTLATIPSRFSIEHGSSVTQFLADVQARSAEAMPFQYAGLQHIKRLSPDAAVACDSQNLIAVNSGSKESSNDSFWDMQNDEMAGTNFYTYPLMLSCHVGTEEVEIDAHYDEDILPTWQMERLLHHFEFILERLSSRKSDFETIGEMELLSPKDRETISSWNSESLRTVDRCVHHIIQEQAAILEESKPAICSWDASFTYRELDQQATCLASHLHSIGVSCETIVPLCFEKSAWTIVAMLAVLKAGGAFVPLNPADPEARLRNIVSDVNCKLVLCSPRYHQLCSSITTRAIAINRSTLDQISSTGSSLPNVPTSSAAYIIFTSGTTGKPKGTIVEHAAFCTGATAHGSVMQMQGARVLQFASYTFDASVMEILTTLMFGGCICVPSEEARMNNITNVINEMDVNWTLLTPSFVQLINPSAVPRLQTLVLGGEAMSQSHISTWSGSVHLMNAYGPSETSIIATINPHVSLKAGPGNMGRAIGGRCWIADPRDHNRLVPIGSVGELLVEGPILARGYLNNFQKTAESFVDEPKWIKQYKPSGSKDSRVYKTGDLVKYAADGSMVYLGRKDTQVKLRGQRLELGEVEHHLGTDPVIQHALAAIPTSGCCQKRLVAVISLQALARPKSATKDLQIVSRDIVASYLSGIRERIGTLLPAYMVPSNWLVLQELPLLPSGKLDRRQVINWIEDMSDDVYRQISDVEAAANTMDRDATAVELQLQSIWGHVLNLPVEKIAFNQSFLHLGGDSMSAMQVMARCRSEALGVTVQDIMQSKSIPHLASKVTLPEVISYKSEEIEKNFDLSPIQQLYFECMGNDWTRFNQSASVRLKRKTEPTELIRAIEAIVNSHPMLRARYTKSDIGIWQQRVTQDIKNSHQIRFHGPSNTTEQMSSLVEESQKCLNISEGPIIAVDVFNIEVDERQLVSFVAHHLIIDVVSWRIIIQDLEDFLRTGTIKAEPSLPFQTWCRLQAEQTSKETAERVLPNEDVPVADLDYWGMLDEPNLHGDAIDETFELGSKTTLLVLGTCHEALNTDPVDVFTAAIIESFRRVFPDRQSAPAIYNEGHGREPWDPKLDISQTVGWFTTVAPIYLPAVPLGDDNLVDVIRWVKDLRRRVPEKGRSYFAYRHLTAEGRERFSGHWPMEAMFNYLGQTQQMERDNSMLQVVEGVSTPSDIGPNVPRFSLFEISASVTSGSVKFTFTYNKNMKRQASIRHWVTECQKLLQEGVAQLAQMRSEPTMSDFPLLPLSYNGLSKLNDRLPQAGVSSIKELEDAYPCSPVQQGILFTQIRNPAMYSFRSTFEVRPTELGQIVDISKLAAAWRAVVQRHSTLRTVFVESIFEEGMMDQVVIKQVTPKISWVQCDDFEVLGLLKELPRINCTDSEPPHRLTICKTSATRVFCLLEMSHAICDGTSMSVLYRDLAHAYEGRLIGNELRPVYSNYIAHMQQSSQEMDINYWKAYLADIEPCYFPPLNDGAKHVKELRSLDLKLTHASDLHSFCTRNGVTLSNVLQLVWALVLQSYTGQDNVCFGYLTAGRDLPINGIQDAIGLFINMLTCRVSLTDNLQLSQVLKQIQSDFLSSMTHQHISLADVQHELPISGVSLFNTAYSFQKRSATKDMGTGQLSFEILEEIDPSEYDLTVNAEVWESSAEVQFCYWTDTLSDVQAQNMASTFDHILGNVIQYHDQGQTVGELDLLSEHCQNQLSTWNRELPAKIDRCVHEIIEQHAQTNPSVTPAVCGWDANFTYVELNGLASRLGTRLRALGVGPETFVPLCFEKSAWTIVAMLGVLKAGGAFVPLDPSHPESRHKLLVDTVKAKIVLCSPQHEKKFATTLAKTFIVSNKTINQLPQRSSASSKATVTPDNPAYIIFTSGTTGLPKGTIIEHGAFSTGGIAHAKAMNMHSTSRVLQFASYTFDASIMEILSALLVGACVCVPSDQERMGDIPGCIKRMGITWTLLTPSVAKILKPENVPSLKVLVTGGEAMSEGHIEKWAGKICLVNAYGPSEASVVATTSTKVDESGNILDESPSNIGRAVGSRSWVVDSHNHNRLMPIGSIGELVVEGRIVARGYLKNEQKTKEAFISNPTWSRSENLKILNGQKERMYKTGDLVRYNSDGSIVYVGRKDTQIKLNGQRIELGEIEHHVKVNLPDETQSAVDLVAPESRVATKALAVFFSPLSDAPPPSASQESISGNTSSALGQSTLDEILLPLSSGSRSIARALESALGGALPAYMVPTLYIPILRMPWTTSGKLDRGRLRNLVAKLSPEDVMLYKLGNASSKRTPATEMEKRLQKSWEAVLHLAAGSVGADDSFFRVGGDSITAMQLVAAARLERVSLTVLNIFRYPKLSEMANTCIFLEDDNQQEVKPFALLEGDALFLEPLLNELAETCSVSKDVVQDAYPASSLQEGLITLSIKQPGAYIAQNVFQIPAGIDISRFQAAWQKTVDEVDILRTRIVNTKSIKCLQVVLKSRPLVWHTTNNLQAVLHQVIQLPEHNGGPLAKYTIVEEGKLNQHYFVWTLHHALYDGWSLPMILKRVEANYFDGKSTAPKSSYVSFIKYLSDTNMQASDDFWKTRLLEALPSQFPSPLSTITRGVTNNKVQMRTTQISRSTVAMDITLPTMIRAAWAMVVAAYTGSDDVVFGETFSGRDVPVPGITDILGPTLTTVPTRILIDHKSTVNRFLKQIQQQVAETIPYQHAGLQHIRRLNSDTMAASEFQNLLVIQTGEGEDKGRLMYPHNTDSETNFFTYPLVIECNVMDGRIETTAHHNCNVISSWQVQRLLNQFGSVVKELGVASKGNTKKISQIDICSPEDIKTLKEWNRSKLGVIDQCIQDLFLQLAKSQPEATAISSWDGELTYREVGDYASRLAKHLMKLGVEAEVLVPTCLDKSAWSVVTMLGVLIAGGALVPLDPAHPMSRHTEIVVDTGASLVLASPPYRERFTDIVDNVLAIDEQMITQLPPFDGAQEITGRAEGKNAAIAIYTSGSTGKPKGVLLEHRSFCTSAAAYRRAMFMKSTSRVFSFASYAFDAIMLEVFSPLTCGACVCIPNEYARLNDIPGAMNSMNVTWSFLTPSVANILDSSSVPCLEVLVCGGEALSIETVNKWADKVKLINGYGPTECTVFAVCNANVSEDKDPSCIGRTLTAGHTWVVDPDDHNRLSPVGSVGELLIEGPTLARGYINNEQKTSEAFIEDPAWTKAFSDSKGTRRRLYKTGDLVRNGHDGRIFYVGRKDNQVKLHGQRMELGEIEHRLETNPRIRHVLVVLPKKGLCKQKLLAVLSLSNLAPDSLTMATGSCQLIDSSRMGEVQPELDQIQDLLSNELPPFMVPTTWLVVEAIPMLISGKLDRKKVQAWIENIDEETYTHAVGVGDENEEIVEPDTDTGMFLRQIWSRVLNIPLEKVGANQSFIALGGDSITAMQVMARCREEKINLSLHEVLRSKSITQLSQIIDSNRKSRGKVVHHVETVNQVFELSPVQQLFFDNSLDQEHGDRFNQSFLLRITKNTKAKDLERAIETIINQHSMLRSRFSKSSSGIWQQRITDDIKSSYYYGVHDLNNSHDVIPVIHASQARLNIKTGPLFIADLFNIPGEGQILSLIGHHLVIDMVSWLSIMQDLETILLSGALKVDKPISFQAWCAAQASNARQNSDLALPFKFVAADLKYWGMANQQNTYGDLKSQTFMADKAITASALGSCHKALRTDPVDLFLSVIAHSFSRVFVDRAVPTLFNEGHGREPWDNSIDLSRTVGWFTSLCPVQVPVDREADDVVDTMRRMKDTRRQVPDNGRPYFAHRYLTEKGKATCKNHMPMEISFNYLGHMKKVGRDNSLLKNVEIEKSEEEAQMIADVGPKTSRLALFEISAAVLENGIQFSFMYNKNMQRQTQIRRWISEFRRVLEETVTRLANKAPEPTLSDLPLMPLTYEGLRKLSSKTLPAADVSNYNEVEDIYPCSAMQEGMLLSQLKEPGSYLFHTILEVKPASTGIKVDGQLLLKSWQDVVDRHAVLRTVFINSVYRGGTFDQIVFKQAGSRATLLRCKEFEVVSKLNNITLEEFNQHNRPQLPHLVTLCETPEGKIFMKLEMNHAVTDGASTSTIMSDLARAYDQKLPQGEGPSYSEYIKFINSQPPNVSVNFWKAYLERAEPCYFPTLNNDNRKKRQLGSVTMGFTRYSELQALCKKSNVTLPNVMLAGWALVLRSYTDADDVSFGYLTSGRDIPIDGIRETVGVFINMLVYRLKYAPTMTLKELFQKTQDDYFQSLPHQHVSLAKVQHELNIPRKGLFNTAMSIQNSSVTNDTEKQGINFDSVAAHDPSEFAITLNVNTAQNDEGVLFRYWSDIVTDSQAQKLASSLADLFNNIIDQPNQALSQLSIFKAPAQSQDQMVLQPGMLRSIIRDATLEIIETLFKEGALVRPTNHHGSDKHSIANDHHLLSVTGALQEGDWHSDYHSVMEKSNMKRKKAVSTIRDQAPSTFTEQTLMLLWTESLGLGEYEIGIDDSFFQLGGDSIIAMTMVGAAREEGLNMDVGDVFRNPTFGDMVRAVHAAQDPTANNEDDLYGSDTSSVKTAHTATEDVYEPFSLLDVESVDEFLQAYVCPNVHVFRGGFVDVLPCTDFQSLAITGTLLESRWMLNYFYLDGRGSLDLRRLKQSAFQAVQAFDILRTVFIPHRDRYLQVVLRQLEPEFNVVETDQDLANFSKALHLSSRQFCPRLGESYVQFTVAKQKGTDHHRIIIRISHAQYDGVCFPAILDALRSGYNGESIPATPSFSTFVSKSAGGITHDHYTYWQHLLQGSKMTSIVHRERPNYNRSEGTTMILKQTITMKTLSSVNITPATVIKAAWSLILAQISAQSDIVFGHVISGRNTAVRGVESIIGPCVNMVPVRIKFQSTWSVLDLLNYIQNQQVNNMPFESLGFREIIKQCTDWPDWTNFSTVVQHQSMAQSTDLHIGENIYSVGAVASQEDFADFTIVSQPKSTGTVEVCMIFAPNTAITSAFAEQVLNGLCHTITSFTRDPHAALPSPSDLISMQRQTLEDIILSSNAPSLASVLQGLSKRELYVLSDSLGRAWRQILRDKQGNFISIPPNSSFFNLGGDIIGLAQVATLLEREGYKVRLEDLIDNPIMQDQMALLSLQSSKVSVETKSSMSSLPAQQPAPVQKKKGLWRSLAGKIRGKGAKKTEA